MPNVLFVAGHVNIDTITADRLPALPTAQAVADRLRGGTGSHGEREWTGNFVQLASDALRAAGVDATFTDAVWHADVYDGKQYDLVICCHYHRDADSERAMFATVDEALIVKGVISAAARGEAQRFVDRLVGGYTAATGIPVTEPLVTLNMTQLYSYDYIDAGSPMLCAEFGNANLDAAVLYEPGVARIVRFMRDCVLEHLNLPAVATPPPARRPGDTAPPPPPPAITDARVLMPPPVDVLHEWARIYAEEASFAGIRPEIALAQALHETGSFTFPGRARAEWNNPCGLGVGASSGAIDCQFQSKHDGVVAHLEHLLMYFKPNHTLYCQPPTVDPRHGAHRGYPDDIRALNGHWAVPGTTYGEAVLALVPKARELLAAS